jgi:hypothetical protein
MSQWGMALLCAYIFLGVCRAKWRRAGYLAVILTAGTLAVVMVSYMTSAKTFPNPSVIQVTGSSVLPKVNVTGGPYIPPGEDKTGRAYAIQGMSRTTSVPSGCGGLPGGPAVTPSGQPTRQPNNDCPAQDTLSQIESAGGGS